MFSQNHDQVGNRPRGERLPALVAFEAQKLAAATVLLSPFIPLLFMGEEYGETAPFQYFVSHNDPEVIQAVRNGRRAGLAAFGWRGEPPDPQHPVTFEGSELNRDLLKKPRHRLLREFYREVLRLRSGTLAPASAMRGKLRVHADKKHHALLVDYFTPRGRFMVAFNYSAEVVTVAAPLRSGHWLKRLDSTSRRWGGPGSDVPEIVRSTGSLKLKLSPRSVLALESTKAF